MRIFLCPPEGPLSRNPEENEPYFRVGDEGVHFFEETLSQMEIWAVPPPRPPPLPTIANCNFFAPKMCFRQSECCRKTRILPKKCSFYSRFHTKLFAKIRKFIPIFVNQFREFFGLLAGAKRPLCLPPAPRDSPRPQHSPLLSMPPRRTMGAV